MFYDEPKCSAGGDRCMLIEFGDELSLELNFFSQGIARATEEQNIAGIIETAPFFASLLIHYEPDEIGFGDLQKEISSLAKSFGQADDVEVDSRLLYMPAVYLDPWTAEAMQEYREAGCTHVMLELWGEDRLSQLELFGRSVLPHFRQ